MKLKLLTVITVTALVFCVPTASFAARDHAVRGYVTKSGKYVAPTRATNPNKTQRDNYSSKPNVNPATGKPGTRTPTK